MTNARSYFHGGKVRDTTAPLGLESITYIYTCIIIIIKRISGAPIYHTRWQYRALYNNTNHTHTHTHTASNEGMGRAVKNSLEIIIKQVRLEGGFERGGRIRVAECLR